MQKPGRNLALNRFWDGTSKFHKTLLFGIIRVKIITLLLETLVQDIGWYPELVFTSALFSNCTNLAVVVPENFFVEQPFENRFRDLFPSTKLTNMQFNHTSMRKLQ